MTDKMPIDEPLYLAKYIERMGTGTRDMIRLCREAGLREPESAVRDGFVQTLWRPTPQVTQQATPQVAGQVTGEVTRPGLAGVAETGGKEMKPHCPSGWDETGQAAGQVEAQVTAQVSFWEKDRRA